MIIRVELGKPMAKAWGPMPKGVARQGIMIHYDGSQNDKSGLAWLEDDKRALGCYHYYVLDDGRILQLAPPGMRAHHAGPCKPSRREFTYSDGNNAFYGISIAATEGQQATAAQLESVALLCRYLFWLESWKEGDTWRITGHEDEAVFPAGHAKAGQRGRKQDPTGPDPLKPVLSMQLLLDRFAALAFTGIP